MVSELKAYAPCKVATLVSVLKDLRDKYQFTHVNIPFHCVTIQLGVPIPTMDA